MKRWLNFKKINLFTFSILIFLGLAIIPFNGKKYNFDRSDRKLESSGAIIDLEAGKQFFGATVDTNLDGFADTLYMWGDNTYGQIGNSSYGKDVLIPIIIEPTDGWNGNIIDLSLGTSNSGVIIDTDDDNLGDTLYVWGNNTYGEVGNSQTSNSVSSPTVIEDKSFWGGSLLDLNFGDTHSGILVDTDNDGFGDKIYTWGHNNYGQLGLGDNKNRNVPTLINSSFSKIIDFDFGLDYSGIITDNDNDIKGDDLYTWGRNDAGQLGTNNNVSNENIPTLVFSNPSNWSNDDLMSIEFSENASTLLSDSNNDQIADTIWIWGTNVNFQIGGNLSRYLRPNLSAYFDGNDGNIINISLGLSHMGVIVDSDSDGKGDKVLIRGGGADGQIGNNAASNASEYVEIAFQDDLGNPVDGDFTKIALRENNSSVLIDKDSDGYNDSIYIWGNNDSGQVGKGTFGTDVKTPYFAFSLIPTGIDSFDIETIDNESISLTLILKDGLDIFNEANIPMIKVKKDDGDTLTPTLDEPNSDFASDTYVYTLSGLNPGTEYHFNLLIINDSYNFEIDNKIITDYLISGVTLNNTTETNATFDLDLSLNNNFDLNNFDESQRKVKINFDDATSFETVINANNQIIVDGLDSLETYNIESIDYNFDEDTSSYKYNILTPDLAFQTEGFDLILDGDSFTIDNESITSSSFRYSISINNLLLNEAGDGFRNYSPASGLYLIDDNFNSYQTTYVSGSATEVGEGIEQDTFKYNFTFELNNLSSEKSYNFVGISFTNPLSEDDPAIVYFDDDFGFQALQATNNSYYIWIIGSFIIILIMIILLILIINHALKKHNDKMEDYNRQKQIKKS